MNQMLAGLVAIAEELRERSLAERLRALATWHADARFHVVVCGEFKRGKSSLVNALIGTEVCPADVLPETAVPAVIEHGAVAAAEIERVDGTRQAVAPDIAVLRRLGVSGGDADGVRLVHIRLPAEGLADGTVLIDTPGVNDLSRQRADITYGFLPLADAAVVVLDSTQPVTRSEEIFLREQLLPAMRSRLVVVLGKADRLDADELSESVEGAGQRLRKILGFAVTPIPVSALSWRERPHPGLAALRAAQAGLRATAEAERGSLAARRIRSLASELRDAASALREQLVSGDSEAGRQCLARVREGMPEAVARLEAYLGMYGREALRALIDKSLDAHMAQVHSDLAHQLGVLEGGLDTFVGQHVPHQMVRSLRSWAESAGPAIHAFQANLVEHVCAEVARAYGASIDLAGLPAAGMPELVERSQRVEHDRVLSLVTGHLLPTTIPMVAGLLLFGPLGMIGGMALGQVAKAKLESDRIEQQRAEAAAILEREFTTTVEAFRAGVHEQSGRWFDSLRSLVEERITQRLADAEDRFERDLAGRGKAITEAINRIDAMIAALPAERS